MRIVFIGAVDFSRHCLQEVIDRGGNVIAVVTLDPSRHGVHSDYADLGPLADRHGIPCYRVGKLDRPEHVEWIRSLRPDVIFVFGWSQLVSKAILDIPALGCVGSHPALLPRNRGRHPLIWTLVEGLEQSGLSFFYLDESADSGDVLWQKRFNIALQDDAGTLYAKMTQLGREGIREFLPQLLNGSAPRHKQDDRLATYWRKRTESDGEIEWSNSTMTIYNVVRALTRPYGGAHTFLGRTKMLVWKARLPDANVTMASAAAPGTVVSRDSGALNVKTGDGMLRIVEFEARGARVRAGERLGAAA